MRLFPEDHLNPRRVVTLWFESKLNEYGSLQEFYKTVNLDNSTDMPPTELLFRQLSLDYVTVYARDRNMHNLRCKEISGTHLKQALQEIRYLQVKEQLRLLADKIKCKQEDLSQLRRLVLALTGRQDEVVIGVLAQFCWQVKRKIYNQPIVHPIMPILFGKQGSGKSHSISLLCKPLNDVTLYLKVDQLGDERRWAAFHDNFITVLDEMQGADRADIESLKAIVSASTLNPRMMHTNDTVKIKQNCTFIGSSNKQLTDQIRDNTGMRRYFQIDTLDRVQRDVLATVDFTALWAGIDEARERGYTEPVLEQLEERQQALVVKDSYEEFLEEMSLEPIDELNETSIFLQNIDIYKTYALWCEESGIKTPMTKHMLFRKMRAKGFSNAIKKLGTYTRRGFIVKDTASAEITRALGVGSYKISALKQ